MKRLLLGLIAFFTIISIAVGQSGQINVTFRVITHGLSDKDKVYVTGSLKEIGGWNPDGLELNYVGDSTWEVSVKLPNPSNFEYKFTRGSWSNQAADENEYELINFNTQLNGNQILIHTIQNWTDGEKKVDKGQITGMVKYHRQVKGVGLKDRDVVVWLPPGYDESFDRFPVLYMHDGQNIFDPSTSSFGFDWRIDESLDSLIKIEQVPPMIVVGINNTDDRTFEYTPGELGNTYMKLVTQIIKPYIDQTYRTLPDRKNTMVGGSSAGGIISFMILWTYPEKFSKAICMSPAFKTPEGFTHNFDFVKTVQETKTRENVKFYIDNGGIGLESQLQPGIDDMLEALGDKNYKAGVDFVFLQDSSASHNEAAWAKRFPNAILWLLK